MNFTIFHLILKIKTWEHKYGYTTTLLYLLTDVQVQLTSQKVQHVRYMCIIYVNMMCICANDGDMDMSFYCIMWRLITPSTVI